MIRWRYITGEDEPASWALAADEVLMRTYASWALGGYAEPALRIYTYRTNSIVIGRYQNMQAEVNVPLCKELGIDLNRRMTGGGTGLMGDRQLMVTLASSVEHPVIPSHPARILAKLARGVIAGLKYLGVDAEFRAKNDIVVNGRKIGGTALCIEETGALLYHATVLVDFDIDLMLKLLNTPAEKISDKGLETVADRMTSIRSVLGREVKMSDAREAICRGFESVFKMNAAQMPFTETEVQSIDELSESKYSTDKWIYQRQPADDMTGECISKTPGGLVRAYVGLTGDTIKNVMITGDFFSGNKIVNNIESALKWGRADRESIFRTVRVVLSGRPDSIQGISPDELSAIIYGAVTNAR